LRSHRQPLFEAAARRRILPPGGGFRNEIVWCYSHGGRSRKWFGRKHDIIFFYAKSGRCYFDPRAVRAEMRSGTHSFGGRLLTGEDGRKYRLVYGTRNSHGVARYYKYYLDEGKLPEDWWADINSLQASAAERTGYPTQKPEALLDRIVAACSRPGDLVLDAYCGSGTSLVAAERAGRRWVGIDLAPEAIALTLERLKGAFGDDIVERIAVTPTLSRPHNQHRHRQMVAHGIDGIAEDQVFQAAVAVRAHDHQIGIHFAGVAHDFAVGAS
jgi:hypothetical protein